MVHSLQWPLQSHTVGLTGLSCSLILSFLLLSRAAEPKQLPLYPVRAGKQLEVSLEEGDICLLPLGKAPILPFARADLRDSMSDLLAQHGGPAGSMSTFCQHWAQHLGTGSAQHFLLTKCHKLALQNVQHPVVQHSYWSSLELGQKSATSLNSS